MQDEAAKLGLDETAVAAVKSESSGRLGAAAAPFWRSESMRVALYSPTARRKCILTPSRHREEIEAQHQKLRESLRGLSRKRHREAAKRERKKGAGKRNIGGGGAAAAVDREEEA